MKVRKWSQSVRTLLYKVQRLEECMTFVIDLQLGCVCLLNVAIQGLTAVSETP